MQKRLQAQRHYVRSGIVGISTPLILLLALPLWGQTIINNAPHLGSPAVDLTYDPTSSTLFVAELTGGLAYLYTPGLLNVGTIPAPVANSNCTGIAHNPANNMLYWSFFTAPNTNMLWQTTLTGASPVLIGPLAIPGIGAVSGIDFDNSNVLWACDGINAQYSNHNPATGAWLGTTLCPNPAGVTPFGFGLSFRGASFAGDVFEVPNGPAALGQVSQITPLTMTGCATSGASINVFAANLSVFGVEYDTAGSTGVPAIYVLEFNSNTITELAANALFNRGDCLDDGLLNIADILTTLNLLFLSGTVNCLAACDSNGDGIVDISDVISLANFLFLAGPGLPAPTGVCGADSTGSNLGCNSFSGCP